MIKSIINTFDHLELCLVINLMLVLTGLFYGHGHKSDAGVNWTVLWPSMYATGYLLPDVGEGGLYK